jgi:hypothetical protein
MKTIKYIIAVLLTLNSFAMLAGNDDVIVNRNVLNVPLTSSLAPVTPKEAGFDETPVFTVFNDNITHKLEPASLKEAGFEETTEKEFVNAQDLLPTLPVEASFED